MNETTNKTRSRTKLLLLAAIGFGPLFIAYAIFFYFPSLLPSTTTNNGELIDPPIFMAEANDSGKPNASWSLMVIEIECGNECEQLGYLATQVVKGLGKDSSRVSKVLMRNNLAPATTSDNSAFKGFTSLRSQDTEALSQISLGRPGLFLRDPNGNIILFYPVKDAGKPMLKDLKHLLKLSNIG